jgi:hypothetical protein
VGAGYGPNRDGQARSKFESVGVMCVDVCCSDTDAREDEMTSAVATLTTRQRDDCLGNKIAEQKQSVELRTRTP